MLCSKYKTIPPKYGPRIACVLWWVSFCPEIIIVDIIIIDVLHGKDQASLRLLVGPLLCTVIFGDEKMVGMKLCSPRCTQFLLIAACLIVAACPIIATCLIVAACLVKVRDPLLESN